MSCSRNWTASCDGLEKDVAGDLQGATLRDKGALCGSAFVVTHGLAMCGAVSSVPLFFRWAVMLVNSAPKERARAS